LAKVCYGRVSRKEGLVNVIFYWFRLYLNVGFLHDQVDQTWKKTNNLIILRLSISAYVTQQWNIIRLFFVIINRTFFLRKINRTVLIFSSCYGIQFTLKNRIISKFFSRLKIKIKKINSKMIDNFKKKFTRINVFYY